ncbi:MAG: PEP/pyruvate-binding domain-containing protein [Lachnospiraceae bacterium]|nr:PEP/pyruvate-binding domain-containing protein [Lachnospiraceae bacterium]
MYLLRFEDIRKEDVNIAGGKGANLGEMTQAGIPVPPGCVLSSQAYRHFIEENHIAEQNNPQIREQLLAGTIPEDMKQELLDFYRGLGDNTRVAIRSSATAEDLEDASFAGQQETYLNVVGEEMLLKKIIECYASLWGKRAVSYRQNQGYGNIQVSLAIVIQQMIPSEKAGVLFTANPATGNPDEMLIDAAFGLGETVVSGLVTPDEYVCDRNGCIIRKHIARKEIAIVYGDELTQTITLPEEQQTQEVLDDNERLALITVAKQIEQHYGHGCDIEWGIADGKVYILQARAITTLNKATTETIEPPIIGARMKKMMRFMLEKEPFAYYPLDYDFSILIDQEKGHILSEAGMGIDNTSHMSDLGVMSLPTGKKSLNRNIFHIVSMYKDMMNGTHNVQAANKQIQKAKTLYDTYAALDFSAYDAKMCVQILDEIRHTISQLSYARFRYAIFPSILLGRKLSRKLNALSPKHELYEVLSGQRYKTAEINWDMAKLAELIKDKPAVTSKILQGASYNEIVTMDASVTAALQHFFQKHGCKEDFNCYCLIAKSWNEDKNRFLQVLQPMLQYTDDSQKVLSEEKGMQEYQELLTALSDTLSKDDFEKCRKQTEIYRNYHTIREESQYLWESLFEICRRLIHHIEMILFGNQSGDIKYLFYRELHTACEEGVLTSQLQERITLRKEKRHYAEAYWNVCQEAVLRNSSNEIQGTGASAGTVTGSVCIVLEPAQFGKLKKGDILVCKYTDPEWTPLFTLASAVVSDTGGSLSHAAIVAREYGIPAVLGTGTATSQLKDGDLIYVNGDQGEVIKR